MKKLTAVVVGYGMRGDIYSAYAIDHPQELEIVAVAEPLEARQKTAKERLHLSDKQVFSRWEDLADMPKLADFAIITTQDSMHYAPAIALIEKGYHLLLEKPMAPTAEECLAITEAAEKKGVKVIVCHVLRFTKFFAMVKKLLDEDALGEIMSIIHMENVGNIHQSHSYVRGNWHNEAESSCMIMAKCCHDMDLLQWLIGKKCRKVQSFGSLTHFTSAHKPAGAPDRCTDGCPVANSCYYNAVKLYYDTKADGLMRSVAAKTVAPPTDEQVWEALKTGPYGRCVYACDNDVVDHQVVNMEFEGGTTVSFTMNPFNKGGRFIRIFGTKGEMVGDFEASTIDVYSFATRKSTRYTTEQFETSITNGHGGGDTGIMVDTLRYLRGEGQSNAICTVRTSCENHLIGFAAEKARVTGTIVDMEQFSQSV